MSSLSTVPGSVGHSALNGRQSPRAAAKSHGGEAISPSARFCQSSTVNSVAVRAACAEIAAEAAVPCALPNPAHDPITSANAHNAAHTTKLCFVFIQFSY